MDRVDEVIDPLLPVGSRRCKCTECNRYFAAVHAFDAHFRGDECRDPATVMQNGKPRFEARIVLGTPVWGWPTPAAFTS